MKRTLELISFVCFVSFVMSIILIFATPLHKSSGEVFSKTHASKIISSVSGIAAAKANQKAIQE